MKVGLVRDITRNVVYPVQNARFAEFKAVGFLYFLLKRFDLSAFIHASGKS